MAIKWPDDEQRLFTFGELLLICRTGRNPRPNKDGKRVVEKRFNDMRCGDKNAEPISGETLAHRVGMQDKMYIYDLEKGKRRPQLYMVNPIAEVLRCDDKKKALLREAAIRDLEQQF